MKRNNHNHNHKNQQKGVTANGESVTDELSHQKKKSKFTSKKQQHSDDEHDDSGDEECDIVINKGGIDNRANIPDLNGGSIDIEIVKSSPEYERRILPPTNSCKRKYIVLLGYLGSNYSGLQINPGALTIESLLEKAMYLAGAIEECNYGNIQKIGWSRAARTDKGVHAIGQCCSMKLITAQEPNMDTFIASINDFLPSDIKIFAMLRTTKSFNAKLAVSHRRYQYLMPTFLLSKPSEQSKNVEFLQNFRIDSTSLASFIQCLKLYEGTHNFHNFTSNKDFNDANAKRHVINMGCSEAFVDEVTKFEWIVVDIVGQSFLLHQIRKMIGCAISICDNVDAANVMKNNFSATKVRSIPLAPALGLYLDELYFDRYNGKLNHQTHDNQVPLQKIEWTKDAQAHERIEAFKKTVLWPHIFQQENETNVFKDYLLNSLH